MRGALVQARADHQPVGLAAPDREQPGRVARLVLAVAVDRDDARRTRASACRKAVRSAAALPWLAGWRSRGQRQAVQLLGGAVRRAVVDDEDADALRQRRLGEAADRSRFVVGGNDDPDAVVSVGGRVRDRFARHRDAPSIFARASSACADDAGAISHSSKV
jgi:hypothetical protein